MVCVTYVRGLPTIRFVTIDIGAVAKEQLRHMTEMSGRPAGRCHGLSRDR